MHETHLIQPIIRHVTAHARKEGAEKVVKVRLKIGELTGLKEAAFKQTFSLLTRGTILETADLEVSFFLGDTVELVSFDIA
jgi:hydrogenase nickel incorporation protein HypA/HybF